MRSALAAATASTATVNNAYFLNGYNGENVAAADYIGQLVPVSGTATGLKVFDDPDTFDFAVLAVPGVTDIGVAQELRRVAARINAFALFDVPDNINARDAIDFSNGAGAYSSMGRIDSYRLGYFWNWTLSTDVFSGVNMYMPPSVAVLGAMARTFDQYKPWYAAAGPQRGLLPEASGVRYPRVSADVKEGMVGNGNCLNPILLFKGGSIQLYGERTSQRVDSKLTAIHTVHLVNYIVKTMSTIGRRYIFDPNDAVLLDHLRLEFTTFMDSVKSERGVEMYQLVIDGTNNTAADRNSRQVNCNLLIIPIDVMERLNLAIIVNESGAVLNTVNGAPVS